VISLVSKPPGLPLHLPSFIPFAIAIPLSIYWFASSRIMFKQTSAARKPAVASIVCADHALAKDRTDRNLTFTCKYCTKKISGHTRFIAHLAGQKGQVASCVRVPDDVKAACKEHIATVEAASKRKTDEKEEVVAKRQAGQVASPGFVPPIGAASLCINF